MSVLHEVFKCNVDMSAMCTQVQVCQVKDALASELLKLTLLKVKDLDPNNQDC